MNTIKARITVRQNTTGTLYSLLTSEAAKRLSYSALVDRMNLDNLDLGGLLAYYNEHYPFNSLLLLKAIRVCNQ